MSHSSELVVVAMFPEIVKAHLACSALRAAGIIAHVDGDYATANRGWSDAVGGVRVLVAASDVDAAREVLGTPAAVSSEDEDAADAAQAAGEFCPRCGSEALSTTKSALGLRAITWLRLGIAIPVRRHTHCAACGHTFR